ncbi:unnamed protein product, partial [marine sediment metagenome]
QDKTGIGLEQFRLLFPKPVSRQISGVAPTEKSFFDTTATVAYNYMGVFNIL